MFIEHGLRQWTGRISLIVSFIILRRAQSLFGVMWYFVPGLYTSLRFRYSKYRIRILFPFASCRCCRFLESAGPDGGSLVAFALCFYALL